MDDPWGSPWATDDTQLKLDLPAPPPQVHTPQTPHKVASPWTADDEDDAWGGWNAAEGGGGTDSPGWGRSPGLRPARSGTVSRHVSPEPWGRLGMLDSRSDITEERKSERGVPITVDSAISLGEDPFAIKLQEEKPETHAQEAVPGIPDAREQEPASKGSPTLEAEDVKHEDESLDRAESPTGEPTRATAAPDRPEATRQPSKVQELVHMYDGIAKRRNSPAEPLVAGPRIVLVGSDGVTEQDDEEVQLGVPEDKEQPPATQPTSLQDEKNSSDFSDDASEHEPSPTEQEELVQRELADQATEANPAISIDAKVPSIPYAYDLKYLDELFPATPTPSIDPEPVPDVIIDDTFASISERKAWYRISRRGPMRQHNQGNDEDYVRLDWRSSEVRNRTLHIVRRWMEEDSIAGRVVLGRRTGPVGASMFNWDSQAPQVEIGELFGKKSHRRSISGTSRGSKGSLPSPSSAAFGWNAEADGTASVGKPSLDEPKRNGWIAPPLSVASSIAPSFGWSSEPQGTAGAEDKPQAIDAHNATRKALSPILAPPAQAPRSLNAIISNGPTSQSLKSQPIEEADNDDDDEWGEMVSSPTWPSEATVPETMAPARATADVMVKVKDAPPPARPPIPETGSELLDIPAAFKTSTPEFNQTSIDPWQDMNQTQPTSADDGGGGLGSWLEPESQTTAETVPSRASNDLATTLTPSIAAKPESASTGLTPPLTADEQAFVERTLKALPDLSYMLR